MPYELFHKRVVRAGAPQLSIRSGKIAFNAHVGDILARVGVRFVHLLWDNDACTLAIQPVAKEDENSFSITIVQGRRGGTFSAKSFLAHIQWSSSKSVTVPAHWNESKGILEAALPRENVGAAQPIPSAKLTYRAKRKGAEP